jgi:hypothetical protein
VNRRTELVKNWGSSKDLGVGTFSAFSPYAFLHSAADNWYPSAAERDAAIKTLPYLSRQNFVHQRVDNRSQLTFTFVRRPLYYAIFNSGPHLTSQQRYGLGLIWQPGAGSLLQSQTGTVDAAWGTILGERPGVYEADTLKADYSVNGKGFTIQPGNRDLPPGPLSVKYSFSDQGEKVLRFGDKEISVGVHHSGPLRENIPLLVGKNDTLTVKPGEVMLERAGKVFAVKFDPSVLAELLETKTAVGPRRIVTVVLKSKDDLVYVLDLSNM